MIYIESKSRDPYFNLALEEVIFEKFDKKQEYFLLWQNTNSIIVGKYQNTAEEINQKFVDEKQIAVARRLSGGGAVYHDDGNLNFTYIVDFSPEKELNFRNFAAPIIEVISKIGIDVQFAGRNDLIIDGKKISGSSQYVKEGRILNHGCILLNSNLINIAEALKPKEAKFISKSTKSVKSRVTTINEHLSSPITMDAFKKKILKEIQANHHIQEYQLTETDIREIETLRAKKYTTWEWNYGKAGRYEYQKDAKFDYGLVSVRANIEDGIIREIKLYGDFFGNGNIQDVEQALIGERLDNMFSERIEKKINIEYYINGMSAIDLQNMLRW